MVSDRGSAGLADGAGRLRRQGVAVAGPPAAAAGCGRTGARRHVWRPLFAVRCRAAPRCGPRPANVATSRGGDPGAEGEGRASPALTAEWEVPKAAPLSSSALPVTGGGCVSPEPHGRGSTVSGPWSGRPRAHSQLATSYFPPLEVVGSAMTGLALQP